MLKKYGDAGYTQPTYSFWQSESISYEPSSNLENTITYRDEARECINNILQKGRNVISSFFIYSRRSFNENRAVFS